MRSLWINLSQLSGQPASASARVFFSGTIRGCRVCARLHRGDSQSLRAGAAMRGSQGKLGAMLPREHVFASAGESPNYLPLQR